MLCGHCGGTAPDDNKFCEECGLPLNSAPAADACSRCGASASEMDAQGFCSACGFRRDKKERDHVEIVIGPEMGGVTDKGLRHHHNEDDLALQQVEAGASILVVCDGVSSSAESDTASRAAAHAACKELVNETDMAGAFAAAQAAVIAVLFEQTEAKDSPSSTMVAAVIKDGKATVGWVGDSRAYWMDASGLQQLSEDDSWMNEVVTAGKMTEAEARKSDKAHAITRWLGADAEDNGKPTVREFDLPGPGFILLCTDGLWNYVPAKTEMEVLLRETANHSADAVTISRRLVDFAKSRGGSDNITAAVLQIRGN